MKEWQCVKVDHHKNVGKTIEEYESKRWHLHTYSSAQFSKGAICHYLLFERDIQ